jgi:hypothetical protein
VHAARARAVSCASDRGEWTLGPIWGSHNVLVAFPHESRRTASTVTLEPDPSRVTDGCRLSWTACGTTITLINPIAPPKCALRLSVEVTPDVPDPTDAGFLSSLLGNHPGYQLLLLSRGDDTHVTLQLQGPGPASRCQEVVAAMRDDGRIESMDVN